MAFQRRNQNRRKLDAAQRHAALTEGVRRAGPPVLRAFGVLLLVAGIVGGAIHARSWALTSPRFALHRIDFQGVKRASEGDSVKAGGLTLGANVFGLDVAAVEHALLAQPWVRQVRVTRELPDAVQVTIEEHVAVAMASLGDLYLVNDQGELFKKLAPEDRLDLPLLTGVAREAYVENPRATAQRFREALMLARAYEASGAAQRGRLSEVRIEPSTRVAVTETGQEIRFAEGPAEDALRRLFQVRRELARHGLVAEVIHLDNRARPDRVAVKLASLGATDPGAGPTDTRFASSRE